MAGMCYSHRGKVTATGMQKVKGQSYPRPKIDLEAWRRGGIILGSSNFSSFCLLLIGTDLEAWLWSSTTRFIVFMCSLIL